MDLINSVVPIENGNFTERSPLHKVSRFTWISPGNGYALKGRIVSYQDNIFMDPWDDTDHYSTAEHTFPVFIFISSSQFSCTIDWGDGTVEKYDSHKKDNGYGIQIVGNLSKNRRYYYVRGNTTGIPQTRSYLPDDQLIANHQYTNNDRYNIVITFSEDANIERFTSYLMLDDYPTLELPDLIKVEYLGIYNVSSQFKISDFSYLKKLVSFGIRRYTANGLSYIPDSLFNCTALTTLNFTEFLFDNSFQAFYDNLGRLENLVSFQIKANNSLSSFSICKFIPALNEIKGINEIFLPILIRTTPQKFYDGITEIFPQRSYVNSYWDCMQWGYLSGTTMTYTNSGNSYFAEYIKDIKGIEKVGNYNFITNIPSAGKEWPDFPEWFDKCYQARVFITSYACQDQVRMDSAIKALYKRTALSPIKSTWDDGNRNPYYGLTSNLTNNLLNMPDGPSGTYQAPEGFKLGVSNGNPSTPAEMVYVMVNNYHQTFSFRNFPMVNLSDTSDEDKNHCYLVHNRLTDTYSVIFNTQSTYSLDLEIVAEFFDIKECKDYVESQGYEKTTGFEILDDIIRNQYT